MIIQKLFIYLLVAGLVLQATVFCAPTKTPNVKGGELSPELKQNALKFLSSVARDAGQFKLAENRVRARISVAGLMWEHDEQAARLINQNAFTELRNLLGQTDAVRVEEMSDDQKNEFYRNRFRLSDLRREYVLTLAAHDSAAAIDALSALETKKIVEWEPLAARLPILKLETAMVIAAKDPNRAYEIYKGELAADGITVPLIESFDELQRVNPELTAKIFKHILAVIKTATIGGRSAAGNSARIVAASSKQTALEFWEVTIFLNAASKLKRRAERDKKSLAPLADAELKELSELLARAFLTAPNPAKNTINAAITAITRHAPDAAQLIRQKVGAEGVRSIETVMKSDDFYLLLEEKNADELALEADRAAEPDHRDLLYSEAARKALDEGEAEKAQKIAARIKNRERHVWLIETVETAVPFAAARRGDTAAVRKLLARLKTRNERLAVLLELVSALAVKGDKEAAKKLFDEAERMLVAPPQPGETNAEPDLEAKMEILGKFAAVSVAVAPEDVFTNVAVIIEAINPVIERGNSSGSTSLEAKEWFYDLMERQLLLHVPNAIDLLKKLARADFERTVKLLDKFEEAEIRLLARLRLAQALLDPRAAEKEKEMREQFLAERDEL